MTWDRDLLREWGIILVAHIAGVRPADDLSREHLSYSGHLTRMGAIVARVERSHGTTTIHWTDERARAAFRYPAAYWGRVARESGIPITIEENVPFLADTIAYWALRGELPPDCREADLFPGLDDRRP